MTDESFMQMALELATQAQKLGEVPVGAILVRDGHVIASGHNQPRSSLDPSAHAEIVTLRQAAQSLGNYRLVNTTLFVTVEPCMMCTGALVHARVERIVIGALEPKAGCCVSHPLANEAWLNHQLQIEHGVLEHACSQLMQNFFQTRRQ
ncbi:MAG: tRNA adenosine(34) deaminase TadA [Pseudomonadota bacterium]